MREAIGGSWLFQIVIAFVLLFTGYMCLTINSSKAFNVKNEIIKEIERAGGVDLDNPNDDIVVQNIANYMKKISYRTEGKCPDNIKNEAGEVVVTYTGFTRDGVKSDTNHAFCIAQVNPTKDSKELPDMSYYRVIVFYQLDLPIFNQMFNFRITGDTRKINTSYDTVKVRPVGNGKCKKYKFNKVIEEKNCNEYNPDEIKIK